MWPQKLQISLRIGPELRVELEEIARRENRTLGNAATLLLEWGYEKLKAAGTIERLRQCGMPLGDKEAERIRAAGKSITHGPKVPMSPGVREDVWKGMKKIALKEDKTLSSLAVFLLEWSILQLSAAGSTDNLLKYQVRPDQRVSIHG
jgi:hypothetical protein